MRSAAGLGEAEREDLLRVAASDRTLQVTYELMLFGLRRIDGGSPERPVLHFVRDVLRRHPAFGSKSLEAALEHPGSADDGHVVRIVGTLNYAALPWGQQVLWSKKQASTCRANALRCILLWFRENLFPPLPVERIQHYLYSELWAPSSVRECSDTERVRVLVKNRDYAALAVACGSLQEQVVEAERQATASRAAESRAMDRVRALENVVAELEEQLRETQTERSRAIFDLDEERHQHEIERTNLRDDYETLRGRVVSRLGGELTLLKEGLLALRRVPPKVSVMDDHADRVISGLTREVDRLRGKRG